MEKEKNNNMDFKTIKELLSENIKDDQEFKSVFFVAVSKKGKALAIPMGDSLSIMLLMDKLPDIINRVKDGLKETIESDLKKILEEIRNDIMNKIVN